LALEESLRLYFSQTPKLWLISLRANRDLQALLSLLGRLGPPLGVVVSQAYPERLYHSPETLAEAIKQAFGTDLPLIVTDTPTDGLAELQGLQRDYAEQNPLGVITGSLYTAGEILHCLERGYSSP
jgi:folylpolyglutamate synthase/dihydropteroate synthase